VIKKFIVFVAQKKRRADIVTANLVMFVHLVRHPHLTCFFDFQIGGYVEQLLNDQRLVLLQPVELFWVNLQQY
jgi:hypothetical protein